MSKCPRCGTQATANPGWCVNCGHHYGGGSLTSAGLKTILPGFVLATLALFGFLWIGGNVSTLAVRGASEPRAPGQALAERALATHGAAGTMGARQREGPFEVLQSQLRRPTVRIVNHSETTLRFTLVDASGREHSMDVQPDADNVLQVDTGHYDASVADATGIVGSATGDATFREYHEYRSEFWVVSGGGDNGFHIGD